MSLLSRPFRKAGSIGTASLQERQEQLQYGRHVPARCDRNRLVVVWYALFVRVANGKASC